MCFVFGNDHNKTLNNFMVKNVVFTLSDQIKLNAKIICTNTLEKLSEIIKFHKKNTFVLIFYDLYEKITGVSLVT